MYFDVKMHDILITMLSIFQSILFPSLVIGLMVNIENFILHALFIYVLEFKIRGSAFAVVLSQWTSAILHVVLIVYKGYHTDTWKGWNKACLHGWVTFLKLAVPGTFMLAFEVWSVEITTFCTGLSSKSELAAFASLFYVGLVITNLVLGISAAVSMRVGIHLGAGHSELAYSAVMVAISCGSLFATVVAVLLVSCKDVIPHFFSNDSDVLALSSHFLPLLAIYKFFELYQTMCAGILRGTGLQMFGAAMSFIANVLIALPLSLSLMFATSLRVTGAWWGEIAGTVVLCVVYSVRIIAVDWNLESKQALKRADMKLETDLTGFVAKEDLERTQIDVHDDGRNDYKSFETAAEQGEIPSKAPATDVNVFYGKVSILIAALVTFTGGLFIRLYVGV
nr:multidrug and toxin extrusion protein 1-like isoform X1 [Crassostrea gigas]